MGIVKKVKFGTPTQVTIPMMDLELSKSCEEKLGRLPMSRIQSAYVVQEVLKAEISEQTCGKVDARGSFVGLGSAEKVRVFTLLLDRETGNFDESALLTFQGTIQESRGVTLGPQGKPVFEVSVLLHVDASG